MSDFKWEMQERIDRGMNPDDAYHATREAYADAADLERKRRKEEEFHCDPDESGGIAEDERRRLEDIGRDNPGLTR